MLVSVIGNPVAGQGRARSAIAELVRILKARGHRVDCFLTEGPGSAEQRVREAQDSWDALLVVGGDGTLNEAVNGLSRLNGFPVGLLPAGTGNVAACELGLSRNPPRLVRALEAGWIRRIDVGYAGMRRFLMLASAGFDAMVTREVARRRTGTFNRSRYVGPLLTVVRGYRPPELRVRVDRGPELRSHLVVVSKTPFYGGVFTLAKQARCDSGAFEVCLFGRAGVMDLLRYVAAASVNATPLLRDMKCLKAQRLVISAEPATAVEVDGDYLGETPVTLRLEGRVLPFVVTRGRRKVRR